MNKLVSHFDIHVYFKKDTPSEPLALDLQHRLKKEFPHVRTFAPQPRPVGPHPIGMWEAHLTTNETFAYVTLGNK